jgi:prevent-host-death family protein
MTITTLSNREFNQDVSKAKRAAMSGPVCITDRGHPAYVLLTYKEYQKIAGARTKIADLLAMPADTEDIEFDIPTSRDRARPADFS